MRSLARLFFVLLAPALLCAATAGPNTATSPWQRILSSINLSPGSITVIAAGSAEPAKQVVSRVDRGAFVVLEGDSETAEAFGFSPQSKHVVVRSAVDARAPKLSIVWEKALELPVFNVPKDARVFAWERWEHAPLMAGLHRGSGAVLWIAASPGVQGYERFPYLPQALYDLGARPPVRSQRLWAFFDSAYRSRVDLDYFAERWHKAGIAALHVAGWHYFEPDKQNDAYLRQLIEACHRQGILVYVWLELPHVSEKFWADHPEWREKTALLQDAQLDWRKLMDLQNPQAAAAVRTGVDRLIRRFDWDGVNLAELYFESLEGVSNPARFTPMNDDVRREFEKAQGFDPLDLFRTPNPPPDKLRLFLDYRAGLALHLQTEWIGEIESLRREKPDLDLVLTHVDDRFDPRMHDLIGADAARVLPMLDRHDFTFLIEDPATIWNLGPARYPQIAKRYQPLTSHTDRLAIDINIVERYQDVYPTKQQTGEELFQLVHLASESFPRVALYFENSILPPDLELLPSAAADVTRLERPDTGGLVVDSPHGTGVQWHGPARVNGRLWPVRDGETLWLPSGPQVVEPAPRDCPLRIAAFNGGLRSASCVASGVELAYQSESRAIALLSARPENLEIDGAPAQVDGIASANGFSLILPRGQHLITIRQ